MVVGPLTASAAALEAGAGALESLVVAGLELELVDAEFVSEPACGLLLLQPAAATTPATASTVASFWYFIERPSWDVVRGVARRGS